MREELKKKLTVNRAELVGGLDVTGLFLPKLSSNGVITEEHLATIRAEKTHHEQVDKLIDILLRRPDATFDVFCNFVKLQNTNLFDLLTKGPGSSDAAAKGGANNYPVNCQAQDAQQTNEELKIKTQKVFAKIKASLDPKGHVVDTLFEKGIITPRELKEITNGPDKETRACCLLDHLFETPHPRAFVVFREALKKDYVWVVEFIDKAQ